MGLQAGGVSVSTPSQILVQPFSSHYQKQSGKWYKTVLQSDVDADWGIPSAHRLYASAFLLAARTTFSAIGTYSTAGEALGNVRLALYNNNNATNYPSSLIVETAAIDASVSGDLTEVFATPITLEAGIYWAVFNASLNATLRIATFKGTKGVDLGTNNLGDNQIDSYWVNCAFGAMPNPFTAGADSVSLSGYMALKVA
jgi:hypothetical protein